MAKDIESLTWMNVETKQQALAKLHAVANKIGYPDKWCDYSAVRIVRNDVIGDEQRASEFEFHRQLSKIGQPTDKSDWSMTPPAICATVGPPPMPKASKNAPISL